jgi:hypothetical protein
MNTLTPTWPALTIRSRANTTSTPSSWPIEFAKQIGNSVTSASCTSTSFFLESNDANRKNAILLIDIAPAKLSRNTRGDTKVIQYNNPLSPFVNEFKSRISSFNRVENEYSEDAAPITADAVQGALNFLDDVVSRYPMIPLPTAVSPSVQGGVMMYWNLGDDRFFAQVASSDRSQIYYQWARRHGTSERGTVSSSEVLQKIAKLGEIR